MRKKRRTSNTGTFAPIGLLLLAILLRLGSSLWPNENIAAPNAAPPPAASETTAEAEIEPASAKAAWPVESETAPPKAEPVSEPISETVEAMAEAVVEPTVDAPRLITLEASSKTPEIRNQTGYAVSIEELAQSVLTFDANADGPTVLLIHTHTTEAYTPEPGWEYRASDTMRTLDSSYNMVRVGNEVERVLTEAGLWVIHDEQINDCPSYNSSYGAALKRIEMWLTRFPTIQVVLDLHRDAAEDAQGRYLATACTVDGTDAAQLMLVCGTDYGGLEHPGWRQNLAFAVRLQQTLELTHPGICRPLNLRCERFNQHATPMSLLVEVGSVGDTLRQALVSAQALGQALTSILLADH